MNNKTIMTIELMQIPWKDYLKMDYKLIGVPAYYTINPDTNRCIIWPTPADEVKITVEV